MWTVHIVVLFQTLLQTTAQGHDLEDCIVLSVDSLYCFSTTDHHHATEMNGACKACPFLRPEQWKGLNGREKCG
jgi:hypothetical protein